MASQVIAGIDIGSTKVAVAIAVVENDGTPKIVGESSYPSQGIKKGEITGIEDAINSVQQALNAAERMAGFTVSSVFVSINGRHITSNNNKGVVATTQDNEINADDVFRAMDQAKTVSIPNDREIIHLIPREFVVDTSSGIKDPIGMTGGRLEVDAHIVSATNTALHNLRKTVQTLGLRIDEEVFTGWAAAQSVLTSTEKELGVLMLDIGGGTTSITTYDEGAVTYSACIPLGGANVTRDLAAMLRLTLEDAEKLKLNYEKLLKNTKRSGGKVEESAEDSDDISTGGQAGDEKKDTRDIIDVTELNIEGVKTISRKMFNKVVEARMQELFEIVRDNIAQAGFNHKLPAGVILTGGSSHLPGLTVLAKTVFGMPARVGQPRGVQGLIEGVSSPAYSVLQGLILEGLRHDDYNAVRSRPLKSMGGGSGIGERVMDFIKNLLP